MLNKHLLFWEGDDFSGELKHTHVSDDISVEKDRQTNLLEKLQPYRKRYVANLNYKKSCYVLYSGLPSLNKIIANMDSQYIIIIIIIVNTLLIFKNN